MGFTRRTCAVLLALAAAAAGQEMHRTSTPCSSREAYLAAAKCAPDAGKCGVVSMDAFCTAEEAATFKMMAEKGFIAGKDIGSPAAIFELHQGIVSSEDGFISYHQKAAQMKKTGLEEALITRSEIATFGAYIVRLRDFVHANFAPSLAKDSLKVATPIFFSRLRKGEPAQPNDEYWHSHIDTEQYGTFAFTTLTYLSTQGEDFVGGSLTIDGKELRPVKGRVAAFTSGPEHPHNVEKVTSGARYAVTIAFTCAEEGVAMEDLFGDLVLKEEEL
eukprot:TRINITY_DN20912_c0_g1_i1.p1 TRINITY_DN20912_c0_g1~~TRINITY_DN20912_c0_g1_i1.p1  ORF type:complete len:274 (+),score=125.56 TRINITY_DN20912_c0_g1_i1:57-878(+)